MHISYHYHLADTIFLYSHWLPHIFFGITGFVSYISTWWYYSRVLALLSCTIHTLIFPVYSTFTLYFSHSRVVPSRSLYCLIVSAIRFAAAPVVELPGICAARTSRDTRIYHQADTTPYHQADTLYLFFTLTPTFSLTSFCSPVVFIPGSCALAWHLNIPLSWYHIVSVSWYETVP